MKKLNLKPKFNQGKKTAPTLSEREKEVLELIAVGLSSEEISLKLQININTVFFHRKNIMRELGALNAPNMIKLAFDHKILK